jgi:iron complex outermembrane receptor protein
MLLCRVFVFFITVLALCVLALCGHSRGQGVKDTLSRVDLEEVVVTGTRIAVSRNNVPLTVSVITSERIENSSESALLPVLSEQIPGLFVTQRGITGFGVSTGSAGQISLRGIGGSPNTQVLILLNGNPQFMGIMGHPLPDAYVASDIERVEVIRGPASTLYGTNAMGGVINLITKEQKEDGFRGNARLMYGCFDTQKYMANGGFRKENFNVFASFNHDQTEGHRDSSDFSINNGYVRMGYELNPHLKINADFSLADFAATDPGPVGSNAGNTIDIVRGMGAFAISNAHEKTNGSVRFFYNFGEHNLSDGFHSLDNNFGLIWYQAVKLFKGTTITAGFDCKKYGGKAENRKALNGSGVVFTDTTVCEAAGYAYIQQELLKKLVLNAGFRLEHNSVYGSEPVPSAGMAYHAGDATVFKASLAKGFRSPTIRELYMWGTANEHLKPERMINYEAGMLQKLAENRLSLELILFKSEGDNLIRTVPGSNGAKFENTGTFSNKGIEFSGTYKPVDFLTIQANYSYISMDEPVVATPEQHWVASASWKWRKFKFHLSAQHVSELYTQVAPQAVKESYTLIHSRAALAISESADVFVKLENLTDQDYEINSGYPMPGFVAFVGFNVHF